MKNAHIISPNTVGPFAAVLLTRSGAPASMSTRKISEITTGRPTTSAMKTVRRDHSISPSERSNTRMAEERTPGGDEGRSLMS